MAFESQQARYKALLWIDHVSVSATNQTFGSCAFFCVPCALFSIAAGAPYQNELSERTGHWRLQWSPMGALHGPYFLISGHACRAMCLAFGKVGVYNRSRADTDTGRAVQEQVGGQVRA
jgi:hypothetical protein